MFNDKLTFPPSQTSVPDVPGTFWEGGYYAGRIMVDGQEYALVVAPKTQGGEGSSFQWRTTNNPTFGTDSRNDGWSNTLAMVQAGSNSHLAATFCRGLTINGYLDWYLPSRDELEILYRSFKPTTNNNSTSSGSNPSAIPPTGDYTLGNPSQTDVDVFKSGGGEAFDTTYYWSSTQSLLGTTSYACYFTDGSQVTNNKNFKRRVRAVRRVAI